jgi:putative transposase
LADLREIYGAPPRAAAEAAIECSPTIRRQVRQGGCLPNEKEREALLAFFDFPAEHCVFATVRHRTVGTKGALSANTP